MLKNVRKSRILLSIVAIALMFILLGNMYSLAAEDNTVTITATNDNNTANTNNTTNTGNTVNLTANTNNTTSNTSSIVSNNTTNNTTNNTSTYNNTNTTSNSTKSPHTGSSSKTILLVVIFALSAVYAYKKVSDYNVS